MGLSITGNRGVPLGLTIQPTMILGLVCRVRDQGQKFRNKHAKNFGWLLLPNRMQCIQACLDEYPHLTFRWETIRTSHKPITNKPYQVIHNCIKRE